MRSLASLLTVLLVLALAWGNCASCVAMPSPSSGTHDCCPQPKPEPKSCHQQPGEQTHQCSFDKVDLSQAIAKDQLAKHCPLDVAGAVSVVADLAPSYLAFDAVTIAAPSGSPPQVLPLRI